MKGFKIIPVIDILNSKAVHAKRGERKYYKPLMSYLFKNSNPIEILIKIKEVLDLNEFYIADLDSIIYRKPNLEILKEILKIPQIQIILDPGIVLTEDIRKFKRINIKNLILGLETIESYEIITESLRMFNSDNIITSIDMYKGKILAKAPEIKDNKPLELVKKLQIFGIKSIILLDLYRVGQKIGGIPPIYLDILNEFDGNIFVGGGIKDLKDILSYKDLGFAGVLLATALYDGTINKEKLEIFR
ncbi:MAG: HisA/HisF-related TIM barrel protein [Promethearchaeota archaeon]